MRGRSYPFLSPALVVLLVLVFGVAAIAGTPYGVAQQLTTLVGAWYDTARAPAASGNATAIAADILGDVMVVGPRSDGAVAVVMTSTTITGTPTTNVTQWNGNTVSTGAGVTDTGTLRVTPAPSGRNAFVAVITSTTAASNPTRLFEITGSASKTVRVRTVQIWLAQTTATTAGNEFNLVKRTTASSGGTSANSAVATTKFDTSYGAATAVVNAWKTDGNILGNPTLGTLAGTVCFSDSNITALTAAPLSVNLMNMAGNSAAQTGLGDQSPIILRGAAESVGFEMVGSAQVGLIYRAIIEWIEDAS